ncbi:hypothetical protein E2P63_03915, partial [Candidatus Bathyarchaeota archaeon]
MEFNFKPNRIMHDFGSYRHFIRGVKKIGKTTLFRDLVEEEYGDMSNGLLISIGQETGHKALANLFAWETPTWKDLWELIDELVANKASNNFKVIALDTVDELVNLATDEMFAEHLRTKKFPAKSVNDALGGYGAGRKYVIKLLNDVIYALESAGYGLVFIGHTKVRDIREKGVEDAYQVLTGAMETGYESVFADKADIIAVLYTERDVKDGAVQSSKRYIYFRDDGFVDCGTRFAGMPERVPYGAKEYLEAFRTGIKNASGEKLTDEQLKAEAKKEEEARIQEGLKTAKLETLHAEVKKLCAEKVGMVSEKDFDSAVMGLFSSDDIFACKD